MAGDFECSDSYLPQPGQWVSTQCPETVAFIHLKEVFCNGTLAKSFDVGK